MELIMRLALGDSFHRHGFTTPCRLSTALCMFFIGLKGGKGVSQLHISTRTTIYRNIFSPSRLYILQTYDWSNGKPFNYQSWTWRGRPESVVPQYTYFYTARYDDAGAMNMERFGRFLPHYNTFTGKSSIEYYVKTNALKTTPILVYKLPNYRVTATDLP